MSDFGWDAESKGELAVVEGGRRVKGSYSGTSSERAYWVAPMSLTIGHGGPEWVDVRVTRQQGTSLIPFGIVSPSADLNRMLGSQAGGFALLSSGDFWMNGSLRNRGLMRPGKVRAAACRRPVYSRASAHTLHANASPAGGTPRSTR